MPNSTIQRIFDYFQYKPKVSQRSGTATRLVMATAFSVLLHGAGMATVYKLTHPSEQSSAQVEEKPKKPPEPKPKTKIEISKIGDLDKTAKLEKLRAEKRIFIQELLQALRAGKPISLSKSIIKGEVLNRNIGNLETGEDELVDEGEILEKFSVAMEEAKKEINASDKTEEKIDGLHYFSHRTRFRAYFRDSADMIDLFKEGTYNCTSSTTFIAALESNLIGSKNYGIIPLDPPRGGRAGHVMSWFRDSRGNLWEMENTFGAPPRRTAFRHGLAMPKEIILAAFLVRNGVQVHQLPPGLSKYYKMGVGGGGFPITGFKSHLPDPPDHPIPNQYFGVKDPKPVAKVNKPKSHEEHIVGFYGKMIKTSEIIKEAQVIAAFLSLNQKSEEANSDDISISAISIPDGIDWCKITQENRLGSNLSVNYLGYWTDRQRITSHLDFNDSIYQSAISISAILYNFENRKFEDCLPEKEYERFKVYVDNILTRKITQSMDAEFMRSMADTARGKELLLKIIRNKNLDYEIRSGAEKWFYVLYSLDDYYFFKDAFERTMGASINTLPDVIPRRYSLAALGKTKGERAKEAAGLLLKALKKEENPFRKRAIIQSLANLGYGKLALEYLKTFCTNEPNLFASYLEEERPHIIDLPGTCYAGKLTLLKAIHKLYPSDPPKGNDLDLLRVMIKTERDPITKAYLIAILADIGQIEEAVYFTKKELLPLLLDREYKELRNIGIWRYSAFSNAQEIILSLAEIYSHEIKELLLKVYEVHPELVLEIGDVFVRQGFRSEKIAKAIKQKLYNYDEHPKHRTDAALLLILMGEL